MTKQASEILSFYNELIFHNGIEQLKLDFENWDKYQKQGYTYNGLNIYNYEQDGHYMSYTQYPQWSPPSGSDFSIHFHVHLGDYAKERFPEQNSDIIREIGLLNSEIYPNGFKS